MKCDLPSANCTCQEKHACMTCGLISFLILKGRVAVRTNCVCLGRTACVQSATSYMLEDMFSYDEAHALHKNDTVIILFL